jgi:hypothetical protein
MPGPKEACGKRLRLTKIGKRRNRRNTAVVDNGAFGFDEQVLEALDAHEHAPEIDFEHAARGVEVGVEEGVYAALRQTGVSTFVPL